MKLDLASITTAAETQPTDGQAQDIADAGLFASLLGNSANTQTEGADGQLPTDAVALLDPEMHAAEVALTQTNAPLLAMPDLATPAAGQLDLSALVVPEIDVPIAEIAKNQVPTIDVAPMAHLAASEAEAALLASASEDAALLTQATSVDEAAPSLVASEVPENKLNASLVAHSDSDHGPHPLSSKKYAFNELAGALKKKDVIAKAGEPIDSKDAVLAETATAPVAKTATKAEAKLSALEKHEAIRAEHIEKKVLKQAASSDALENDLQAMQSLTDQAALDAVDPKEAALIERAMRMIAAKNKAKIGSEMGKSGQSPAQAAAVMVAAPVLKNAAVLDAPKPTETIAQDAPKAVAVTANVHDEIAISAQAADGASENFASLLDDGVPQESQTKTPGVIAASQGALAAAANAKTLVAHASLGTGKSERAMEIARGARGLAARPDAESSLKKDESVATLDLALGENADGEQTQIADAEQAMDPARVRISLGKAEARTPKAVALSAVPAQKWATDSKANGASKSERAVSGERAAELGLKGRAAEAASRTKIAPGHADVSPADLAARSRDAHREAVRERMTQNLAAITSKPAPTKGKSQGNSKVSDGSSTARNVRVQATLDVTNVQEPTPIERNKEVVHERKQDAQAIDTEVRHVAAHEDNLQELRRSEERSHEVARIDGRSEEAKQALGAQTDRPVTASNDVAQLPTKLPTPNALNNHVQAAVSILDAGEGNMASALGLIPSHAHASDATPMYLSDKVVRNATAEIEHPELGRIELAMRAEAGGVSVKASTNTQVAVAILEHSEDGLRKSMNDRGVSVKNFKVDLRTGAQSSESLVRVGRNVRSLLDTEA